MTQERYVLPNGTESWKIKAEEGMTCIRTLDGIDFGTEVILGYRYRDAVEDVLDTPVLEQPSDYHEEAPKEEEGGMA